jgi:hypothetical protein
LPPHRFRVRPVPVVIKLLGSFGIFPSPFAHRRVVALPVLCDPFAVSVRVGRLPRQHSLLGWFWVAPVDAHCFFRLAPLVFFVAKLRAFLCAVFPVALSIKFAIFFAVLSASLDFFVTVFSPPRSMVGGSIFRHGAIKTRNEGELKCES